MQIINKIILTAVFSVLTVGLLSPLIVQAVASPAPADAPLSAKAELDRQMGVTGEASGLGDPNKKPLDPREIAGNIVQAVLGLVGIIFFCLTVYAGFLWMTAGGEEEKVTKAKDLLRQAIIGLAVVLSAYAITLFAIKLATGSYDQYGDREYQYLPQWY